MRRIDTEMDAILGITSTDARDKAVALMIRMADPDDRKLFIDLMCSLRRAEQRRRSDKVTDPERRILVGARIPRWLADQYREQARRSKRSLYAWCCEAFREKCERDRERDRERGANG